MDKVERKRLIKSLLSGRLSKKQRKAFADLESVDTGLNTKCGMDKM